MKIRRASAPKIPPERNITMTEGLPYPYLSTLSSANQLSPSEKESLVGDDKKSL